MSKNSDKPNRKRKIVRKKGIKRKKERQKKLKIAIEVFCFVLYYIPRKCAPHTRQQNNST